MPDAILEILPDTAALPAIDIPVGTAGICRDYESPLTQTEIDVFSSAGRNYDYNSGLIGDMRSSSPNYDAGVAAIVLGMFLILCVGLRNSVAYLRTCVQELWSVRNRENAFDDRTASETRAMLSMLTLTCFCEGVMAYAYVRHSGSVAFTPGWSILLFVLLASVYMLFEAIAYRMVGFVFTTPQLSEQWLKGFYSSQGLLGVALAVPALVALFDPDIAYEMLICGGCLYVLSRIIFICKGFRIFYNNLFSLVYFILYLCTLEIIPLLLVIKAGVYLSNLE